MRILVGVALVAALACGSVSGGSGQASSCRTACLAKRNECTSAGVTFADDYCLQSALFAESSVANAQQCLMRACDAIQGCLRPLFN